MPLSAGNEHFSSRGERNRMAEDVSPHLPLPAAL